MVVAPVVALVTADQPAESEDLSDVEQPQIFAPQPVEQALVVAPEEVEEVSTEPAGEVEELPTEVPEETEEVSTEPAGEVEDLPAKSAEEVQESSTEPVDEVQELPTEEPRPLVPWGWSWTPVAYPVPGAVPPPPPPVEREAWISWLRFAAIVGVVLIHLGSFTVASKPDDRALELVATAIDFFSRWAVPVFVMVSGALLLDPARYPGTRVFMRKRVLRLVPALIFWHAVYVAYLVLVGDETYTASEMARRILTGQLYTALYFFWLILGLAAITPILVPWVKVTSHRALLWTAVAAMAVPAFMVVSAPLRNTDWHTDVEWVQTSFTWFIPYLGYYLLGYALRDVVVKRLVLALVALVGLAGSVLLTWQWGNVDGIGGRIEHYAPAEAYYGPTVVVVAVSVFLVARATIRPGGRLGWFSRGVLARIGTALGGATLGVFVMHLLVFRWVLRLVWIGGPQGAESIGQLAARCAAVLFVSYAIALTLARIPFLRRLV